MKAIRQKLYNAVLVYCNSAIQMAYRIMVKLSCSNAILQ